MKNLKGIIMIVLSVLILSLMIKVVFIDNKQDNQDSWNSTHNCCQMTIEVQVSDEWTHIYNITYKDYVKDQTYETTEFSTADMQYMVELFTDNCLKDHNYEN